MNSEVVNRCVVQRFINNFGAPDVADPNALMAEYENARALIGASEEILIEAMNNLVWGHTYRNWPTVGECVAAVNAVIGKRAAAKGAYASSSWNDERRDEPTPEQRARVKELARQTVANLKVLGPRTSDLPPLPDVSRPAWEARFGSEPKQIPSYQQGNSGLSDVSHDAWHARYGYKGGEIDRRFPHEKGSTDDTD